MKIPNENQRVKDLINYYSNGNELQFCKTIGISQPRINRLFNTDKRNGKYPLVSFEIITAIINKFNDVNPEWLLTGNGNMLRKEDNILNEDIDTGELENLKYFGIRFSMYLKTKGLGVNETGRIFGYTGAQISNINRGRVFGVDKLYKILNEFTDLDANWLFREEGSMLRKVVDTDELENLKDLVKFQREKIKQLEDELCSIKKQKPTESNIEGYPV